MRLSPLLMLTAAAALASVAAPAPPLRGQDPADAAPVGFRQVEYWTCPSANVEALAQAVDSIWGPLFDELVAEGRLISWSALQPTSAREFDPAADWAARPAAPPWDWAFSWDATSGPAFDAAWGEVAGRLRERFPDDPRPSRFCDDLTIVRYDGRAGSGPLAAQQDGGAASSAGPAVEARAAEAAVLEFFDALADLDFARLESAVTDDFELIEDTLVLDMPAFQEFLKPFAAAGATIEYEFSDFNSEVRGPVAWTSYRNRAVFTMEGQRTRYEWLESAVFEKQNGEWKLDRLQSAPVRVEPLGGSGDPMQ